MKKWTFLVASAMLVGATPVFTGCIDNDEPEGISVLRGAKAELLRAKVAVEAANAISIKADAALKEAQAKVQEALAANELAKAKILEAQAKQEEAKVELIKTQNEQRKAELEEYIKQCERDQKEWQAEMDNNATLADQAIKSWELAYKQAQVAYEQALVQLATAKATLTDKQNNILSPLIATVKERKDAYDVKATDVRQKQALVLQASKMVEENEANKAQLTRQLEWDLKDAKLAKENAEKNLEASKAELEKAQNMKPHDLAVRRTELLAEKEKATSVWSDAKLALINKGKEMHPEMEKLTTMKTEYSDMQNAEIIIPEFIYKYANMGMSGLQGETTIVGEMAYSLNNLANYNKALNSYDLTIESLKSLFCDDNQQAWTTEDIAMMKANQAIAKESTATVLATWQRAVDAYRTGTTEADLSKFNGYAELADAITAYNTKAGEYNAALAAYNEINNEFNNESSASIKLQKAIESAGLIQSNTITKNQATYDATIAKYENELEKLRVESIYKYAAYNKAQDLYVTSGSSDENLKKEVEKAWAAYEVASKAYDTKRNEENTVRTKAQEVQNAGNYTAWVDYRVAVTTAEKAYLVDEPKDAAIINKIVEARGKCDNARDAAIETLNEVRFAYYNFELSYAANINPINEAGSFAYYALQEAKTLTIQEITTINKTTVAGRVIELSNALYGPASQQGQGIETPRLIAMDKSDIMKFLAEKYPDMEPWSLQSILRAFGVMGREMILDDQLMYAEAYKNNNNIVNETVAAIEASMKTLTDTYDAAVKNSEEKLLAIDAQDLKIKEAVKPFEDEVARKLAVVQQLGSWIGLVNEAIGEVIGEGEMVITDAMIQRYIKSITYWVSQNEKAVYDAETAVMGREKKLADWNKGAIRFLDMAKWMLSEAEIAATIAKEDLDTAQAALDAAIAKMTVEE